MIVVAGGSGVLGQQVVATLLSRQEKIRVVVRDAVRARHLLGPDVEVVAADVRHLHALRGAVAGASVVICAVHGFLGGRGAGPAEVDGLGNAHLTEVAQATGADVVLLSVVGAAPDSPVELFRAKFFAEQRLRESGARWTVVRASAFFETWLGILTKTAGTSGRPMVFGQGNQPISFVSAGDVATVVGDAATDPCTRGQVVEVTGPVLTMNQLAGALQDAHGWQGSIRHLPRPALRAISVLARPVSPSFARQNHTALVMDTTPLASHAEGGNPVRIRVATMPDILTTGSPG